MKFFYFIRTMIFWLFFLITTLFMYFIFFIPRKLNKAKYARLTAKLTSMIIQLYLYIFCGIRIKIIADFDFSTINSHLIISNHQSDCETFFLSKIIPDVIFIIKKELLKIPFFGPVLRDAGYISIDRSAGARALRNMLEKTKAAIDENLNIVIFPQGTRSNPDEEVVIKSGTIGIMKNLQSEIIICYHNSGEHWINNSYYFQPGEIKFIFKKIENLPSEKDEIIKLLNNNFRKLQNEI